MKFTDTLELEFEKALRQLKGVCRLEFIENGEVVDFLEYSNNVTPLIYNSINKGNFLNQIPTSAMLPLIKWFYGIMLIDKNGDATKMSIPHDAEVIACANNASGSESTDLRRGNYNQESSSAIVDENGRIIGFKFVWYWSDTRGNCSIDQKIKAVCLTRGATAIARYGDTLPDDTMLTSLFNTFTVTDRLARCQIIDYANGDAYRLSFDSNNIKVEKYQLATEEFGIDGVYNSSNEFDLTGKIGEATLTPTIAITANYTRSSVSFKNGKLHVMTWSGQNLTHHEINVSGAPNDWTITSTAHTFSLGSGVTIKEGNANNANIAKDLLLLTYESSTYYLTILGSNSKFYKCDLSNDANIVELPGASFGVSLDYNGVFVELSNGDWIKYTWGQDNVNFLTCNYYHNGKVYLAKDNYNAPAGWGCKTLAVNDTGDGVLLFSMPNNGRYGNNHYMALAIAVGSIATVWNINDDDHAKHAGMSMRVVYEIKEQNNI
jgi:hypothetical protein